MSTQAEQITPDDQEPAVESKVFVRAKKRDIGQLRFLGICFRLGARHLAWLIRHEGEDLERVLVCYNAGRTKVRRWADEAGSWKAWRDERVGSGNSEIFTYVFKVLDAMEEFERRGKILSAE